MKESGLLLLAALFFPTATFAHAFGEQFTLPLPVSLFVIGGIGAFIASCLTLIQFSDPHVGTAAPRQREYSLKTSFLSAVFSIAGFVLLIASSIVGTFGTQDFSTNPLPNFFWIIFLLLFTYVTAIIGGLWPLIDPFRKIAAIFAGKDVYPPTWLPYTPAMVFYALLWLELFSPGWGGLPFVLVSVITLYIVMSCVMSRIYGLHTWFAYGDFFTIFFGIVSKVSPVHISNGTIRLSLPGEYLVSERATFTGTLFFIFVILGSTVLDGIRETPIWFDFIFAFNLTESHIFYATGVSALFLIPILLFYIYSFAIWTMKVFSGSDESVSDLRLTFAFSLIPIAVAYHFAHYFSLILSQGQIFISQVSDPLAKGWDLFGTRDYVMNPGLIGADKVWYLQFGAIILGHILAAIIAHRIAKRIFPTTRAVIMSQLPMIVLMVFYTAFGLWTLAQPFAQ